MMSNRILNTELMWEVDRYLLGDDSFDRDAFESRMLEDEALALAVADELQRLQLLSEATDLGQVRVSPVVLPQRRQRFGMVPFAVLAVVACVLCLLSIDPPSVDTSGDALNAPRLQEVALQWMAFDGLTEESDTYDLVSEPAFISVDAGDSAGDSKDDWMMLASEFFREADI